MITLEPTLFYFLLEVIGILMVGCGLLVATAWRRAQRRKVLMIDLVHRLKSAGAQRVASLEAQVKQKHGLSDDSAHEITTQIVTAETHFYQFLVRALLEVDNRQLLELDHEVEHLTDAISMATPVIAQATATPAAAQVESAQVLQLLGTIEKNHAQLLGEIKQSAESMHKKLSNLSILPQVATAAASAVPSVAMAAPASSPPSAPDTTEALDALPDIEDQSDNSGAQDPLESLPDIDDSVDIAPAINNTTPAENETTAGDVQDEMADLIAVMPDDLLSGIDESATTLSSTTPVAAPIPTIKPELTLTDLDKALAAVTPIPAPAPVAKSPPEPALAAKPTPPTMPNSASALNSDDIDALLNGTIPMPSKAAVETNPTSATAFPPVGSTASIDEIYSSEPLIPETDGKTEIVAQPADNSNKAGTADLGAPAANNVDELLAELDALLK